MIGKNNIVYWLVENPSYVTPKDKSYTNDIYPIIGNDVLGGIDSIRENMRKESVTRYVLITDLKDEKALKVIHSNFIDNNILKIDAETYDVEKTRKQIEWILSDYGRENKIDDNNVFFISDTHFNHQNIIRYCERPWNSGYDEDRNLIVTEENVNSMNEEMIRRWNSVVGKYDIVYHLGDFCLGKNQIETIPEIVSRLNGKISLIMGNHDHLKIEEYYKAGFHRVYDRPILIRDFIILSHSPLQFLKLPFFNIYGHVHDTETYKTWSCDSCCVCVERHEYTPVSMAEIIEHCTPNV